MSAVTHVLVVLQEDVEVEVFPEDGMSRHTTQEDLVHGDGLLEDGEVLSEGKHTAVSAIHSFVETLWRTFVSQWGSIFTLSNRGYWRSLIGGLIARDQQELGGSNVTARQ